MNYADCALSYDDIFNVTEECGFAGYFDFSAVFSKLAQENNITETNNLYVITERGKTIADNLEHLIPNAAKNKCAASAARLIELKKLGADFYSVIEPENGGYRLKCGITNKNSELFNVSLLIKEKAAAEKIDKIFNERPDTIYRSVLAVMTGDADFIF
jgi:hypothetical protein